MYVGAGIDVEEPCYNYEHIKKVLGEIKRNFEGYFQRFLETNAGNGLTEEDFTKLQKEIWYRREMYQTYIQQKALH